MATITFSGGCGSFTVDADTGIVIKHNPDRREIASQAKDHPACCGYLDLIRVDLAERRAWYAAHGIDLTEPQPDADVLDVGAWYATTGYCEPENDWRESIILPRYVGEVLSPACAVALDELSWNAATLFDHVRKVGYASQDLNDAVEAMARLCPDAMRERLSFDAIAERLTAIRDLLASFLLDCGGDRWEDFPEIDGARLDMERRIQGEAA